MGKQIIDYLPQTELLAMLAEEAAELSQAELKLRRVLDGTNPTPVSYDEAKRSLVEEAAQFSKRLLYRSACHMITDMSRKCWIGESRDENGHETDDFDGQSA